MGKKVCVEIEFHRIIEKDIELPEGKSVDDIFWCIGGPKGVSIQFEGDDGNTDKDLNIDLDFKDFTERCDYNTGTTLLDEDTNKRVCFG